MRRNHHEAPVLGALDVYHDRGELGFSTCGSSLSVKAAPLTVHPTPEPEGDIPSCAHSLSSAP